MISQRLRELRKEKQLTLQQVATKLGVTRASVSKWETSSVRPELGRLEKLAEVFGVPVAYLLGDVNMTSIATHPVLDYAGGQVFELKALMRSSQDSFPTTSGASNKSFFIRVDDDSLTHSKNLSIQLGSLVLVDPELQPRSGEVVLIRSAKGFAQFALLTIVGGKSHFFAVNAKYEIDPTSKFSVVGVAKEAIHVTDMSAFVKKIISKM